MSSSIRSEFELNADEFVFELTAVIEMIDQSVGSEEAPRSPRTRVAGANAATLLVAATFEEYVRQQVSTAFKVKVARAAGMAEFPKTFARGVWRRSLELIARTPWEEVEGDIGRISDRVAATLAFCLKKDLTADIGEIVGRNEHNMRPGQLVSLFAQIGLGDVLERACGQTAVKTLVGAGSAHEAVDSVTRHLENFFERRNSIAHSIAQNRSSGAGELKQDIEMLRVVAVALAQAVQEALVAAPGGEEGRRKSKRAKVEASAAG